MLGRGRVRKARAEIVTGSYDWGLLVRGPVMELEVRHLKVLVAVADHGSVTKAATALGLSQPALSAQLRRIERAMGGPLFERSQDGVVPNERCRRVLAKARLVLADMADLALSPVRADAPGEVVELRMGNNPGPILSAAI